MYPRRHACRIVTSTLPDRSRAMTGSTRIAAPGIPLQAEHIACMERDGAAALARRGPGWFTEQVMGTVETGMVALLALVALLAWDAPPLSMLMLLMASLWIGIVGDWLKWLLLGRAVRREAERNNADRLVWAVATALRQGRGWLSNDATTRYIPTVAMVIDLLLGGVATLAIVAITRSVGVNLESVFELDATVRFTIYAALALQAGGLLVVLLRHGLGHGQHAPPRFAAGIRGVGLLLLAIIVAFAGDEGRDLRTALLMTNGLLLAFAAIGLWGCSLLLGETRWLRRWLRDQPRAHRFEETQ
jgi:hypothetical protein